MDDAQYDKRFTNRNRIMATNGWTWITVPINKDHKFLPNSQVELTMRYHGGMYTGRKYITHMQIPNISKNMKVSSKIFMKKNGNLSLN